MKRIIIFVALVTVAFGAQAARKKKQKAEPRLQTIEIINRVNNHWQQSHKPEVRSFWDEAAYHTGNIEACRLLGNAAWRDYSETWARHNRWQGATEKDPKKWKYQTYGEDQDFVLFGDWQICFQTYIDLYQMERGYRRQANGLLSSLNREAPLTKGQWFKVARAVEVMDYEVRQPQNDFWWWADALYMVMPVMTKLYQLTGEVKYLDKLYANFCFADSLMFDNEAHLYFRDGRYVWPKHKTDLGKKDFWARGDGWVLAGLAKVLSDMPADYPHRPFFEQRFCQLAEAVSQCQQPDGYWSRSMLDEAQAEGPETSGTAFFCYGMLWGVNNGLLSEAQFMPVVDKAWNYLTRKALQPDGAVGFVQPIGDRAIKGQQLSEKNEANFGVGAFLLAACEHLRYEDGMASMDKKRSDRQTVTFSNPGKDCLQRVMAIDARTLFDSLGLQGGRQMVAYDVAGLEVPWQLSHDGKVLIEAGVRPGGQQRFTFRRGTPADYATVCTGRVYPERKDDYAWENDRTAYRIYGPALARTGEKSYGVDVWSKNTPELVVEQRYWAEDVVMMPSVEQLRRQDRQRGDSLYRLNSYHNDHGRGSDLYKVGATLGCGTPALLNDKGDMVYPYCFSKCHILDNGPLRTTVALEYDPVVIDGDTVTEHRIISLDKGSNFCRMTVSYDGLTKPRTLVSGVALHEEDRDSYQLGKDFVAYADPTDNVSVNNCQLFVATVYPEGIDKTAVMPLDKPVNGCHAHAVGMKQNYRGEPFTYWFGSAWSKNDVRTMAEWLLRIEQEKALVP